jgi:hypothetical protein
MEIRNEKLKKIFVIAAVVVFCLTVAAGSLLAVDSAVAAIDSGYVPSDIQAAWQEGYNTAFVDKAEYELIILDLRQQLVDKENYWREKYDAMVAEKDERIARLMETIDFQSDLIEALTAYIYGFDPSFDGMLPTLGGLNMQLAAYESMKAAYLYDLEINQEELAAVTAVLPGYESEYSVALYQLNAIDYQLSLPCDISLISYTYKPGDVDFWDLPSNNFGVSLDEAEADFARTWYNVSINFNPSGYLDGNVGGWGCPSNFLMPNGQTVYSAEGYSGLRDVLCERLTMYYRDVLNAYDAYTANREIVLASRGAVAEAVDRLEGYVTEYTARKVIAQNNIGVISNKLSTLNGLISNIKNQINLIDN